MGRNQNFRESRMNMISPFTICVKREIREWQFSLFIMILNGKLVNFSVISGELAENTRIGGWTGIHGKKIWFLEMLELDATPIFITIVLITTQKGDHSIENHKSIGQYDLLTLVYNYFTSTTGVITAMFEKCSPKQLLLKNLSASVFLKRKNEFLSDFVACF